MPVKACHICMSICWANVHSPGRRDKRLLTNKRPNDSNDPLVCEAFQRLGKNEIGCAFSFFETNDSKVCAALAFLDRHDPIVLYLPMEVTIGGRFLPKSVNVRHTALFDDLREASRFNLEEFHCGSPGRRARSDAPYRGQKSARELRQGGSDYRCCIPALAGFVSPQSIAPDGKQIFSQESRRATANSEGFREQAFSEKNRRIHK